MSVTLEILDGPNLETDSEGWEHNKYTVRLSYEGRTMESPWMQGISFEGHPTAADVLESLFIGASGYENSRDFEDWAIEYGLDTDSRKAEASYHLTAELTKNLRHLLGAKYEETAIWAADEAAEMLTR